MTSEWAGKPEASVTGAGDTVDFVIITALEEERAAVLAQLPDPVKLDKDGRDTHTYYESFVSTQRGDRARYRVVVTSLASMGPEMAVSKAAAVVNRWRPPYVLLVGIACGVKGEVAHGDVLVAREVADNTIGKVLSNSREVRWSAHQAGANLLDSAVNLSGAWRERMRVPRPGLGRAETRFGVIASGGDVVASDALIAEYRAVWPKLVGLEMEAGGTATGLHNTIERPEFLMVKGVSDFGADKKDPAIEPWRPYSADAAAAFAVALLESGPIPARRPGERTAAASVAPAGMLRAAFDRVMPWLHSGLTRHGLLSEPAELGVLRDYLNARGAELDQRVGSERTYVANRARDVPETPFADRDTDEPFVKPIHQVMRALLGRDEGGDHADAQLAAVNRKSRVVRSLMRTLANAQEPLVLLGDPGTGKTLTLRRLLSAMARRQGRRVYPVATIFVSLGGLQGGWGDAAQDEILGYVKRHAGPIASYVEPLLRQGRLVIAFDGMDEMSREHYTQRTEALSVFARKVGGSGAKTLFSCRIADFSTAFQHRRLVLVPFDREQIRRYLGRFFGRVPPPIDGQAYTLRGLARRLASGGLPVDPTNPFTLRLLCSHLQEVRSWPTSRTNLLGMFLERAFDDKRAQAGGASWPDRDKAFAAWAEFAYAIAARDAGTDIEIAELARGRDAREVEVAVKIGTRCRVLVESSETPGSQARPHLVRFEHHRLEEYFAALYLARSDPDIDWLPKLDAPRWQEILVNVVLLGGGGRRAIDALIGALREYLDEFDGRLNAYKEADSAWETARKARSALERTERVHRAPFLVSLVPTAPSESLPAVEVPHSALVAEGEKAVAEARAAYGAATTALAAASAHYVAVRGSLSGPAPPRSRLSRLDEWGNAPPGTRRRRLWSLAQRIQTRTERFLPRYWRDAQVIKRTQQAARHAPNPPRPDPPLLADEDETRLSDRVELGARLLRHSTAVGIARDGLTAEVVRGVRLLSERGNPLTQLKMIRVCNDVPSADLMEAAKEPLASPVRWVREQAVHLLAASGARTDASIASAMGLDLARARMFRYARAYARAIARSRTRRLWLLLLLAVGCQVGFLVGDFALGAATLVGFWKVVAAIHRAHAVLPPNDLAATALFTGAVFFCGWLPVSVQNPRAWGAAVAVPVAFGGIGIGLVLLWRGRYADSATWALGSSCAAFIVLLFASYAAFAIHLACIAVYLAATRRLRRRSEWRALSRALWVSGGHAELLRKGVIFQLFILFAAIASGNALFPRAAAYAGRPALELGAVAVVGACVWCARRGVRSILNWIKAKLRPDYGIRLFVSMLRTPGQRRSLARVAFGWLCGSLIILTVGYTVMILLVVVSVALLEKLPGIPLGKLAGPTTGRWISVALIAVGALALLWSSVRSAGRLARRLRYVAFPPRSYPPDVWRALIEKADPLQQQLLLSRTNHHSVGLEPAAFARLLREIKTLVSREPALSTYWECRDRLEQLLKQERRG